MSTIDVLLFAVETFPVIAIEVLEFKVPTKLIVTKPCPAFVAEVEVLVAPEMM